jgi:hypothetical protein
MFPTLTEIKAILGITGTSYDARIALQLPIIRQRIADICNNDFRFKPLVFNMDTNAYFTYAGKQVSICDDFVFDKDGQTITCENVGIDLTTYIQYPGDLLIQGTVFNDGYVTIADVDASVITVEDENIQYDEDASNSALVMCNFPNGIKDVVAEMINWDVVQPKGNAGISSESIGGYSVSYKGDIGVYGYPVEIIAKLRPYKMLKVV